MRELVPRTPTAMSLFGEDWPLERMRRDLERTMERWMREFDRGFEEFRMPLLAPEMGPVAGMEEDDFKVEVMGDRLIIRGEKKAEREERKEGVRTGESRYGAFRRTFLLPRDVKMDAIKAEYKNGELRIHLPKTEEAKAKRIEVQVA